jgi:Siphovirus ReqiPepy6 Gp37-like protein
VDLYTLTDQFLADQVVDEFVSAIWTERYSAAGDVQLVLPATTENLEKLKDGTYLALRGTKEVMICETQNIEDNTLTVVGQTLPSFLDQRLVWFKNPSWTSAEPDDSKITDYLETTTAGQFLANLVDKMVINPVPIAGAAFTGASNVNLDWELEKIPYLELGTIDLGGDVERYTAATGPLYRAIQSVAEQEHLGFSLYLDYADPALGYLLKFATYRGLDRTTGSPHPLVRLTPDMDSLSDLKEVRSRANWKNVVYVWYKNILSVHYENPDLPPPEGFERRVLVTDAEGEPVGRKVMWQGPDRFYGGGWSQIVVGPTEIAAFREQNAKDALANHNYIRALDGQTSPNNDYKYGVDYGLGDVIELEGITGTISKARITEYIRSQDKTGEREYPTISVVN